VKLARIQVGGVGSFVSGTRTTSSPRFCIDLPYDASYGYFRPVSILYINIFSFDTFRDFFRAAAPRGYWARFKTLSLLGFGQRVDLLCERNVVRPRNEIDQIAEHDVSLFHSYIPPDREEAFFSCPFYSPRRETSFFEMVRIKMIAPRKNFFPANTSRSCTVPSSGTNHRADQI